LWPGFFAVAFTDGGVDLHGHRIFNGQLGGPVVMNEREEAHAMMQDQNKHKNKHPIDPSPRLSPHLSLAQAAVVLLAGALFGFGLSLSTMIRPEVVLGFLRFQDMGLMLVMGGAVAVTVCAYKGVPRGLKRPLLGLSFHTHVSAWNRDTAVGAALFGVGWGLCGVCPGPAIANLGTGNTDVWYALGGMALGALVQGWRQR
jgi:hypothetical protein